MTPASPEPSTAADAVAVDVELALDAGTDPRAPGAEVTVALCGHWEHEGACRWPHYSEITTDSEPARLRTVVIVSDAERDDVERRIEDGLRRDDRWSVVRFTTGPIADREQALATRLGRSR